MTDQKENETEKIIVSKERKMKIISRRDSVSTSPSYFVGFEQN